MLRRQIIHSTGSSEAPCTPTKKKKKKITWKGRLGRRERKRGRGLSSSPAVTCPDSLPTLIYTYPQGSLCKSSTLTAKKCHVFTFRYGKESGLIQSLPGYAFTLLLCRHMLLRATGVQNSRGDCLLDFFDVYFLLCMGVWGGHLTISLK